MVLRGSDTKGAGVKHETTMKPTLTRRALRASALVVLGVSITTGVEEATWRVTTMPCVVETVIDGDTVKAYIDGSKQTCRLEGIDAPEIDQPFGKESKEALARMVVGKSNVRAAGGKRDLYGRLITNLYVGRINVNTAMVERGYAHWYAAYARKRTDLAAAQKIAKDGERGLWEGEPIAPWDWRKDH